MDLFKLLIYFIFVIQQIQNIFTNQLNEFEYKIEINKTTTNKIILYTNNTLKVSLLISSSKNITNNEYKISGYELKCEVELSISNETHLTFIDQDTNNTLDLYIYLIKYEYNGGKTCFSDPQLSNNIYLSTVLNESNIKVMISNTTNIKYNNKDNNKLTYSFSFNDYIINPNLKVLHKEDDLNSDEKPLNLEYYFSPIPEISNLFYPDNNNITINLSFKYKSSLIKSSKLKVGTTLYEISEKNGKYISDIGKLTNDEYVINFMNKCNQETKIDTIYVINTLYINIDITDIEVNEIKYIKITFNNTKFFKNGMKVYLKGIQYDIEENFTFKVDNQLVVGTYDIQILRNELLFKTNKQLIVHNVEVCNVLNNIIAIQNETKITFKLNCTNITGITKEVEKDKYDNITCPNKICTIDVNGKPSLIRLRVTTWKTTPISVHIIQYIFNPKCSADLKNPIIFTIINDQELDNTKFELQAGNETINKKIINTEKSEFTFTKVVNLNDLRINYNNKNIIPIETSDIILTDFTITGFSPKYLSNYPNQKQKILINISSKVLLSNSTITLKLNNNIIKAVNVICNNNQCIGEFDLEEIEEKTYDLFITNHCKKEILVNKNINVLSNIDLDKIIYIKKDNKDVIISTTQFYFFQENGSYFIILGNHTENLIKTNDNKLKFSIQNIEPNIYNINIKFKSQYDNEYKFETNSKLYLYINDVNLQIPLQFLYVDQKYEGYTIYFEKEIFPWQIKNTALVYGNQTFKGNVDNRLLNFKFNLKFIVVSQLNLNISLVNNVNMTYIVNVIKSFNFAYNNNYIKENNKSILLNFEKYNENEDIFYQKFSNDTIKQLTCTSLNYTNIYCAIALYEKNRVLDICYLNKSYCLSSNYYLYSISNYNLCIEQTTNIEITLSENFNIYIQSDKKKYNFNFSQTKYILSTNEIESNIYQIYINKKDTNENFPIEMPFEIFKSITSKDNIITVNINTILINFDINIDDYINLNKKLTIKLSNNNNNVESIFCFPLINSIQCIFNLTKLSYDLYEVYHNQFCNTGFTKIENLKVNIIEEVVIRHPIIGIKENWIIPNGNNISFTVIYDDYKMDEFKINKIVLVDLEKKEQTNFNISIIQYNENVSLTIKQVDETVSKIFFIKTFYSENGKNYTEISDYPYYLVISKKPKFSVNQNYFHKSETSQELKVIVENINFDNIIIIFLKQLNQLIYFKEKKININKDSKELEGSYTIGYKLCGNCVELNDENPENIIIIHENQEQFFENVKINDCLYRNDLYYVIKIDFNNEVKKEKITIKLNDMLLEESNNYYIIKNEDKKNVQDSNELNIFEVKNNQVIFNSIIKVTNFTIKDDYFYASKSIKLTEYSCILKEYNLTITKSNLTITEERNLSFINEENNIIYYGYKDNNYIYGECKINNTSIFSSNDLKNSSFELQYGPLNKSDINNISILNPLSDFYLNRIESVSIRKKQNDLIEKLDVYENHTFTIKKINRDDIYIIESINSLDGDSSINIKNNVVGFPFYSSNQFFIFDKKQSEEFKLINFYFKTKEDVSLNVFIDESDGNITECSQIDSQVNCLLSLKIQPNIINVTINNYTDLLYEYVYSFINGTQCQSIDNETATKNIDIKVERPDINHSIIIYYDQKPLEQNENNIFTLSKEQIQISINKFDVIIENEFINSLIDKLIFYQKLKIIEPMDEIEIIINFDNYLTIIFDKTNLNISKYNYFLYKKDDPSYEQIPVIKIDSIDTEIYFNFDLFSLKEQQKQKIKPEKVDFGYEDDCGDKIFLCNIQLMDEEMLEFYIERHYLSLDYNEAKIFVKGTKYDSIEIKLIYEDDDEDILEMNKTDPGIFNYFFKENDPKGKYHLKYMYNEKEEIIKQYIYFQNSSKDFIYIQFEFSTHPCLINNFTNNLEVKLFTNEDIDNTDVSIYLIRENDIKEKLNYNSDKELFELGEDKFKNLPVGKYNLTINEISISEQEMDRYNYTLTNVNYSDYYYYDKIYINIDCEPKQFDLISSKDNSMLKCNYYIDEKKSGYNCSSTYNITYGNYTIRIFNEFNYGTFISKYLMNLTKTDFSFQNNENTSESYMITNLSMNVYYLKLIENFTIFKEDTFYAFYTKENFSSTESNLIFQLKGYEKKMNYYLKNITDRISTLNISLNFTEPKYSLEIINTTYYIKNQDDNTLNLTLYFKVNGNLTTPEDYYNIICVPIEDNQVNISIDCINDTNPGIVNCTLSQIRKDNPVKLKLEYNSESKSSDSYVNISINQYELLYYYNCINENKRIYLIIYNSDNNTPIIQEQNPIKDINYTHKEGYNLTYYFFIQSKSKYIKIINNKSQDEQIIFINDAPEYIDKNFTCDNKTIEIGRISQEINLIFENISKYEIPENKIYFNSKNENISITEFNILNSTNVNFKFNVPNNWDPNFNYTFSYINICNITKYSNYFNLNNSEYNLTHVKNTLVCPRDEEELFLNFSKEFNFKNMSVNIGDNNNTLLNTTNCTKLNKEIVCKFNMSHFEYEEGKTYFLLNYEIDKKKYNYSKTIGITNKTYCHIGTLVTKNHECILPDDDDIEQNVDILEQHNFCNYGKGYCMQDNEKKYYCNCKNNYKGIYCEYTNNETQKIEKFKDILTSLENDDKNLTINSLVKIKEIIHSINKTIITKENANNLLKNLSKFVKNIISFYSINTKEKYFIYPFDLAFYIISLNQNEYTDMVENISSVVNRLVKNIDYNIKTNKINTGTLSNFKYSYYNLNEKDNYLPRFEYKNNNISSNIDLNFVKLVIPHTIKNKVNESDILFISVKSEEKMNFTNIKFYFSLESVISKEILKRYNKYKNYSFDIFNPDNQIFQPCFIQNNENIPVDFPPSYIKDHISTQKIINISDGDCKYQEINNNSEIVINCNSFIEKGLYVLLDNYNFKLNNTSFLYFNCRNKINFSTLYNNKMVFISLIIIIIYILYIIIIKIINPIKFGIKNDKLDESQHKIPEQTEMSSAINDNDFDEEENVKVRQTRANFIELKKKESYCSIVFQNFIELHPIISSFRPNILTGMVYKFTMFLFNFFILCFFNVLFYSKDLLNKRAEHWFNEEINEIQSFFYPLFSETIKIIFSCFLSIPLIFIMNLIIITKYDVKNRLSDAISGTTIELERKDYAEDFKKKILYQKLLGFCLMIGMSIFSIYCCTIFCLYYPRTQSCFLYSVIWSLIINWFILSPIHIFIVSHYQNIGNEKQVYYMKRLNLFN